MHIVSGQERAVVTVGEASAIYSHGWHSWSHTAWLPTGRQRRPASDRYRRLGVSDPVHDLESAIGGSDVAAARHPDGSVTLLGALAPGAWVTWNDGSLCGRYESGAGDWLVVTGNEADAFATYVAALGERLGRGRQHVRSVWCSWYSYYEDISATRIDDLLAQVQDYGFDVFQIDDGWQRSIGEWTPNDRFGDMSALAERIRSSGMRPGLWLAPFIAHDGSSLAQHSDMLLHDEAGAAVVAGYNWDGEYFALDVTARATRDWLRALFTSVKEWGYDYLKLDFLYAAAFPGEHEEPTSRHEAYREAVGLIRDTVGDDVYLLGCGAPIIASIGHFDGIRVGPDVAPSWEVAETSRGDGWMDGTRGALATSLHRLWLGPVIQTDPDAVYVRSRGIDLDSGTRHAMEDLALIAGFVTSSDPPSWLTESESARLHALLTAAGEVRRLGPYRWDIDGREVDLSRLAVAPLGIRT